MALLRAEESAASEVGAPEDLAASAVPVAVLAAIVRACFLGGTYALVWDEVYQLVAAGRTATARERVQSMLVGCLSGGAFTKPLRLAIKAAKPHVVAAAIVVAIKLRQICIPRCI